MFVELASEHKTLSTMRRILHLTILACGILYLVIALSGYLAFGEDVLGNVLLNFTADDQLVSAAKVIMAFHVVLAFPVNVYPCRRAFRILWSRVGMNTVLLVAMVGMSIWLVGPCSGVGVVEATLRTRSPSLPVRTRAHFH
jgi:amino acid permease